MSNQPTDEDKMSVNFKDLGQRDAISTSSFNVNEKDAAIHKPDSSPPKGRRTSLRPESLLSVDGLSKKSMAESKKSVAFSNNDDDNVENSGSNFEVSVPKKEKKGTLDAKKIKSSFPEVNLDDAKENVESVANKQAKLQVAHGALIENEDENRRNSHYSNTPFDGKDESISDQPSRASSKGSFNSATGDGSGKEIVENWTVQLLGCKFTLIGLVLNILLVIGLNAMVSESGLRVNGLTEFFKEASGLLTELFMNVAHICTAYALQEGMSTYFGYLMSQPKGYSLAVCAFCHSSVVSQITFTSYLNYRSPSRRILSKASILIAFQTFLIFLTPFSSSFVHTSELRTDSGTLSCLVYNQNGLPSDRGVPTLEAEFGVGEFVFGTSLGNMSSEMEIDHSVHVFPPQLIDTTNDGSTIVGEGFQTDVKTTCGCPSVINVKYLTSLGVLATRANEVIAKISSLNDGDGMVNAMAFDKTSGNTSIVTIFPGLNICGGLNTSSLAVPVCTTVLWNHKKALVQARYMTDGTPASIALKIVTVRQVLENADPTWLYASLSNLIGGDISSTYLPVTYPGSTNTLLWWTTSNLQAVSSSLLPNGVETMFCILLRAAIQRSYSHTASSCGQNIVDPLNLVVRISYDGYIVGSIIAYCMIGICSISLFGSLFWFINPDPILPALRLTKESLYFRMMLGPLLDNGRITNYNSMMPTEEFWPNLDIVLRMGESITSRDDPDVGLMVLEKPRMVTKFVRGKQYK